MSFSTLTFVFLFLPLSLILYVFTPKKYKNLVLVLESILFYLWGNGQWIYLLWFTILLNYVLGLLIEKSTKPKRLLLIGVLTNILILCYYKYNIHIIDFLNIQFGFNLTGTKGFLPLGISFFIFQEISYLVDVYRKDAKACKSFLDFGAHISHFAKVTQGPIVKYKEIESSLKKRTTSFNQIYFGMRRFALGLSKKVLLANPIGEKTDLIFAQVGQGIDTPTAWLGMICYTMQLFFDFSGYSDMALGIGQAMGFKWIENFNYPYIATDISDFWSRWHISLSTFFREYVYFPLGGNRKGKFRTYFNQFVVFFTSGIWHGETLNFLFWGLYHWIFSSLRILLRNFKWYLKTPKIIKRVITFFVVSLGWVLFRSANMEEAGRYYGYLFTNNYTGTPLFEFSHFFSSDLIFFLVIAFIFSTPSMREIYTKYKKNKVFLWIWDGSILILFVLSIIFMVSGSYSPFIYFQF